MSEHYKRAVNQYDDKGKYIKTFKTVEEAAIELMIPRKYIHISCSVPLRKTYNHFYRYRVFYSECADLTQMQMRAPKF